MFHSENASNVFRPHYVGEIWKRNNQRSSWICVWGKLGQGSYIIIVTSSFSKSSVFKMFSVHTKTQSQRFQIPPVWWAFTKSSALFSWRISVDGRPNRRNKAVVSNSSGVVWTVPQSYEEICREDMKVKKKSLFMRHCSTGSSNSLLQVAREKVKSVRRIFILSLRLNGFTCCLSKGNWNKP